MLLLNEMKLVSATYEITRGDWTYRVKVNELYTILQRTNTAKGFALWSHSVLVQAYDGITEKFEPGNIAVPVKFATVEEAVKVIDNITK
jgi:hypothetical protein